MPTNTLAEDEAVEVQLNAKEGTFLQTFVCSWNKICIAFGKPNKPKLCLFGVAGAEKEVRKITTMKSIWGRQNKPKLKLEINEIGQPIGTSATRFANFIGTQVRTKGFPVAYDDWRKVPLSLKLGLWTEVKVLQILVIIFPFA